MAQNVTQYCHVWKSQTTSGPPVTNNQAFRETHNLDYITYPLFLIKQPANITNHTMYGAVESVFNINENLTLVDGLYN